MISKKQKTAYLLFCYIKRYSIKDSNDERKYLVKLLVGENFFLKIFYTGLESLNNRKIRTLFLSFYGLLFSEKIIPDTKESIIAFYTSKNEADYIKNVAPTAHFMNFTKTYFYCIRSFFLLTYLLVSNFKFLKSFEKFSNDKPLYVQLRLFKLFFCFFHIHKNQQHFTNKKFYISTEGQPFPVALLLFNEIINGDINYVAHAPYIHNPMKICANHGYFFGIKALKDFLKEKSSFEKVLIKKSNYTQNPWKLKNSPRVLVAPPKVFNEEGIIRTISYLLKFLPPKNIGIRLHPKSLTRLSKNFKFHYLITSYPDTDYGLARWDILLSEKSTILIEALIYNVIPFQDENLCTTNSFDLHFINDLNIKTLNLNNDFNECYRNAFTFYSTDEFQDKVNQYYSIEELEITFQQK